MSLLFNNIYYECVIIVYKCKSDIKYLKDNENSNNKIDFKNKLKTI